MWAEGRMSYRQNVDDLVRWLQMHHPDNVVMPLRPRSKAPVFPHKDGQWNWDRACEYIDENLEDGQPIGILMRSLIGIDIDDHQMTYEWEDRFPELQRCPKETTKHGAHYILARSPVLDDLAITDVAGGLKAARGDAGHLPVDLKTVASTGTAGVLCVAPSANKAWVRKPVGLVAPMSDSLAQALAEMRANCNPVRTARPPRPRSPTQKSSLQRRAVRTGRNGQF